MGKPTLLAIVCLAAVLCPPLAFAQEEPEAEAAATGEAADADARDNDQTFVIGAGLGSHRFIPPHEAGEPTALEIKSTLLSQYYGEWYVLDEIGFGLRLIHMDAAVSSSTSVSVGGVSSTARSEVEVDITTYLVTVNWVPLGGRDYARLGLLAGAGLTEYELMQTYDPGPDSTDSTSGPAALAGAYLDWGGPDFGARFGGQYLTAALDDIDGEAVEIDGSEFYLDLRWAF